MKTTIVCKSVLTLICAFVFGCAMQASSPKQYMYDTKEENGKITSKVIFLQEDGLLNKQVKYEFSYNDQGKVSEKKAYRWDAGSEKWIPYYLISYTYDDASGNIKTNYGMWNKKKKDFSLNVQNMLLPESSYNDIFS